MTAILYPCQVSTEFNRKVCEFENLADSGHLNLTCILSPTFYFYFLPPLPPSKLLPRALPLGSVILSCSLLKAIYSITLFSENPMATKAPDMLLERMS